MIADDAISSEKCTLVLTGYIRAHGLSVNQLVIYSASVIVFAGMKCVLCLNISRAGSRCWSRGFPVV